MDQLVKKEFLSTSRIPTPAHPKHRHEPLPWQCPKPPEQDPDAPVRLQAILNSPSYRQADQDIEFLGEDDTRGVRLQIDYQKTESELKRQGIQHTIVVFGSTRIHEPDASALKVNQFQEELEQNPSNEKLKRKLAIAKRVLAKSHYYTISRDFGRLVNRSVDDGDLMIMTGGGPGIMEATNRGAHDAHGRSIGLNIHLPHEQYPNPYITPELCFQFHYFSSRKLHFMLRTKAMVAFPGGYGTMDELFEALTLIQTRKINPVPVVLVGEHYWRQALNVDFLVDEGVIDEEDRDLFWYAESAQDIWDGIKQWHERNGTLLPISG